jgi:type 2 lantibiotic biosynthesis protein LanM
MTSQEEAARYFERAGMLLCILYVVGGNDCIVENIIPHGEHPVLIDTETFFQPLPNLAYKSSWGASSAASRELFQNSVLRVGMLPRWQGGQDGNKNDISAFGGYAGARGQFQKKVWESINTERMRYAWKTVPVSFAPSELNGKPIFPGDYVNEIVTGFTKMYQMCIAHRDALIARGGPIDNMKELKLRFLVRSTYIYDGMIHSIQTPRYQTDGMRTSVQVDSLARPYTLSEERPVPWNLIATEHASILQLDVPRFTTTPSSASLGMSSGQKIEDFFVEPSFESMKRQLFVLDRQDLELQIAYIRGSFTQPNQQTVVGDRAVNQVNGKDVLESDEAIGEALEIAERIEKSAIRASDGTATWITHGYNPDSQFWQLQPMGFRLYDGVLGTVLFLAAAHNAEKTNGFRDLALASFKNLLDTSTKTVRLGLLQDGLGAGLGLSSVIYSLLLSGQLLEEPGLIAQAERVADLITRETIQNDRRLDTLGGSAGCLLVLLKLYEATRNERLLDLAILCGEHLVESRTVASNGCLSWQTVQGKYLAGFSHGAAGIGYALCRLSQTTGDARYRNAAVNAYEYENTLFDEKARNWANLLSPSDGTGQEFWTSWCHGAPGIGLGRIGSMSDREDATYETDLKHALESAATAPLNHVDNLCCGTMGRLEVLLEAERTLGLEDCGRQARLIAKQVVRNAKEQGRYNLGLDAGICVPSFHQGMAGIGYQLLRVTDPVRYPSVLSWQSASLS